MTLSSRWGRSLSHSASVVPTGGRRVADLCISWLDPGALRSSAASLPAVLGTSWSSMVDYQREGVVWRSLGCRCESRWGRSSSQSASIVSQGGRRVADLFIRWLKGLGSSHLGVGVRRKGLGPRSGPRKRT